MNVHEIAGVLAYLGSGWPAWKMSDDTADVWATELAPLNVDQAREAARNLLRTSEHQPTVAAFLEQYRQIAYHARIAQPLPELEAGEEPDFDFHAAVADLRDKLASWSKAVHNHKGPGPCPLCSQREREPA